MNRGSPPLTREAGGGGHRRVACVQYMFVASAIRGAAAQSQSLGCLADVCFVASESALNQVALNFVEAHLFQLSRATSSLRAQTEVCRADGRPGREQHPAFHRMCQCADCVRPCMLMQSHDSGRIEPGNILAVALRVAVEKMVRQEIDVLPAVSQRRDVDLDSIQAKEQVLTEPAGSSLGIHVSICSREHSHVDAPRGGRAYALEIPRFQNAQEVCLQIEWNVGDFVQEQRAAIREFEPPDTVSARIGKGPFYVTE